MEKPKLNNTALLVLGMHRSGTSAVTGCFYYRGVYLGKKLRPAADHNQKGFFEHNDISALHEELLYALGSSWDDPRPLPEGFNADPRVAPFRARLKDILLRDFSGHPLWGIKDPRICLLLPLWLPLLKELNVTVSALLVIREPGEVAASLARRNSMPWAQSSALWLRYLLAAELETRDIRRSIVMYEDLLSDWRGEFERIEKELALPLSGLTATMEEHLDNFLTSGLRHHKDTDIDVSSPFEKLVRTAFNALAAWRRHGTEPARALDQISKTLQDAQIVRSIIQHPDSRILTLKAHSSNLEACVIDKEAHISNLESAVREKDARIHGLEAAVWDRDNRITALAASHATLKQIYSSHGWKLLLKYYKIRDRLLPGISKRLIAVRRIFRAVSNPVNFSRVRKILPGLENMKALADAGAAGRPCNAETKYLQTFLQGKLKYFLEVTSLRLELPKNASPAISIILVLFNKAEYTYQCLESLKANADVPYEVIIVDNNSHDQTPYLLRRIDNAVVIRNSENRGFLLACNQGADVAKGEWLLFLNNDTQILPSLLSALLKTAESASGCGAVGGKLILPDGSLQEAGSIIWNDGSCLSYGRGDNPFKPEYSYVREVDYCSGACLLVKRDIFRQAGMFDELFCPAYYEEADLCMKIRDAGYKVLFQPAALVIHYEFGSSGSKSKAIELQAANREKFFQKWRHQLSEHYPPLPEKIILGRDRSSRSKTRILMVEGRAPDPQLGSGYPRSCSILKCLTGLGYEVTLFPLQFPEKPEPFTYGLQQEGIEVIFGEISQKLDFRAFYTERAGHYDLIWIARPHNMRELIDVIRKINPDQKIIYDAEALFSMREMLKMELDGAKISEEAKAAMIKEEISLMDNADAIVTASRHEREIIKKYVSNKNVEVIGHAYSIRQTRSSFNERRDLLFVGSFMWAQSPNEDAIIHFVRDIYPKVLEKINARLWIVGINYLESIRSLSSENIIVTGRVDNLFEYFDKCKVFIVPTRYAAGIPFKLQECLSFGLPAVVTPLIANQLGLDEDTVLIGDSPDDFAGKIIKCYTNENIWRQLRDNGLTYIKNECSYDVYKKKLGDLINAIKQN